MKSLTLRLDYKDFPKTLCQVLQTEGSKLSNVTIDVSYATNTYTLDYVAFTDTFLKVWTQSDPDSKQFTHSTEFAEVSVTMRRMPQSTNPQFGQTEITEEFLNKALEFLEKKYLDDTKARLLEDLARKQLEEVYNIS